MELDNLPIKTNQQLLQNSEDALILLHILLHTVAAFFVHIITNLHCYFVVQTVHRSSKLRRLRLVCCYCISDDGLSEAVKKLPLLEELHIYNGSPSKETLKNVGCCCPLLKSFNMSTQGYRPSHMECDDHALAIAECMPGLRHLQLFGNKMTNDGLQAILDGCPHLESLDIRQCFNVYLTGSLGERVSERIKNLRDPFDSIEDYGFATQITEDDSFVGDYPFGFSDIDFLSDDDRCYEFFGESDLSDYEDPFVY